MSLTSHTAPATRDHLASGTIVCTIPVYKKLPRSGVQPYRIEFAAPGPEGTVVVVEASDDETPAGQQPVARNGVLLAPASKALQDALSGIRPIADALMDALAHLASTPQEITAEFGVKLSATTGVILAKAAAEGHVTVKLTWKPCPLVDPTRAKDIRSGV